VAVCRVHFSPFEKHVDVEPGISLLEAAAQADIVLNSVCGGDGICGRCKMIVREGRVEGDSPGLLTLEETQHNVVLACQAHVVSDLHVDIPDATRAGDRIEVDAESQRFRAIHPGITRKSDSKAPLVTRHFLELAAPSLEDHLSDEQRLRDTLWKTVGVRSVQIGLKTLRELPRVLRKNDFAVTVTIGNRGEVMEIMDVEGGDASERNAMIIVDVGTSTIVAHLVDAIAMTTVDAQACFNSQSVYGREVTARIMAAEKKGEARLQEALVQDINHLVSTLVARNAIAYRDITAAVCSGNTTMMHFLLGLPAAHLRRDPFIAACTAPPPIRAAEVGIKINPRGLLFTIPGISSWVGGDLTAGILATRLYARDETAMLIDVGTNGEIIIGNKDWLMACSASTGPALEGAGVSCGMMAEKGAIEKVYVEDDEIRYRVIGNVEPTGICGSGVIDLLAALLDRGIIDRSGRFVEGSDPRVRFVDGRGVFHVAGEDLLVTQDDLESVITAKAAIFAAIKILLDRLELDFADISKIFLAGGFGSYINRHNAIRIGLLPDLPVSCIQYVGNTSIWGAKLAAFSKKALEAMSKIAGRTAYYDLMGTPDYVEQFQQAMFLPHTDIGLFPSLREREAAVA